MALTIAVDFDGVIHGYQSGWQGPSICPDPPVPGVAEALAAIRTRYRVVILTTRAQYPEGRDAVAAYCALHAIPYDDITAEKIPAHVYIDDRAIAFRGSWADALATLEIFESWTKAPVGAPALALPPGGSIRVALPGGAILDLEVTQTERGVEVERHLRVHGFRVGGGTDLLIPAMLPAAPEAEQVEP